MISYADLVERYTHIGSHAMIDKDPRHESLLSGQGLPVLFCDTDQRRSDFEMRGLTVKVYLIKYLWPSCEDRQERVLRYLTVDDVKS